MRIIIADEYWGDRGYLQDILELAGHEVFLAGDLSGTVEALKRYSPDVLLLDLELTRFDDYQFLKRLRGDARWRHVALIALIPFQRRAECDRIEDIGFDGYVPKPLDYRTVVARIWSIFQSRLPAAVNRNSA